MEWGYAFWVLCGPRKQNTEGKSGALDSTGAGEKKTGCVCQGTIQNEMTDRAGVRVWSGVPRNKRITKHVTLKPQRNR